MAVLRCRACEDVMVAALWVVEKTGEAVAGGARWIRLRVIDASAQPDRPDPEQGDEGQPSAE
jgi:hypothetical protein